MSSDVVKSQFEAVRGEVFRLEVGGESAPLELRLAEVESLADANRHPVGRREPFSLLFRGPLSPWVAQRTWALEHPTLGRLEVFLVPLGPDAEGMRYEAIFT